MKEIGSIGSNHRAGLLFPAVRSKPLYSWLYAAIGASRGKCSLPSILEQADKWNMKLYVKRDSKSK